MANMVRERVLLALVFRYYASGNSSQVLHGMSHLQSLKMKDNNIEGFHDTWNMVMSELATAPDAATLQFVYYNQIKDFKPMSEDIGHYRRAQWNHSPRLLFRVALGGLLQVPRPEEGRLHAGRPEPQPEQFPHGAVPGVALPKGGDRASPTSRARKTDPKPQAATPPRALRGVDPGS